jgi:hypothetical protein
VILGGDAARASGTDANYGSERAVLNGFLSRLTYANVVATVAVFLALGGGAYALTGIPDGGGIYHGCVASSGALRVVTKASSCLKTKTVKRGTRRVRIPGESAIVWNQQGRPGVNGGQGPQGLQGPGGTGPTGSPAASLLTGRFGECRCAAFYAAPVGISTLSATESVNDTLSPAVPIVARDLSVRSDDTVVYDRVYTLRMSAASTALTCAMPPGSFTCTDTTHTVTIPANSAISILLQTDASGGAGTPPSSRFGWRATTP